MENNRSPRTWGGSIMEILVPLGIIALWIILQVWILPRLGVPT
jgi:hypothetical protein